MMLKMDVQNIYNKLHALLVGILMTMMISYVKFDFKVGLFACAYHYIIIMVCVRAIVLKYRNSDSDVRDQLKAKSYELIFSGAIMMIASTCVMEFVGHWYIEGVGSDVSQVLNSIIHTPLYGARSILEMYKKVQIV